MSFKEIGTHDCQDQNQDQDQVLQARRHQQQVIATRAVLGLPSLRPNGGRSTGREALLNAPWARVPTVPDAGFATSVNLASAHPPRGASSQFAPTSFRPGNNSPSLFGLEDGERDINLDGICVSSKSYPLHKHDYLKSLPGWDVNEQSNSTLTNKAYDCLCGS